MTLRQKATAEKKEDKNNPTPPQQSNGNLENKAEVKTEAKDSPQNNQPVGGSQVTILASLTNSGVSALNEEEKYELPQGDAPVQIHNQEIKSVQPFPLPIGLPPNYIYPFANGFEQLAMIGAYEIGKIKAICALTIMLYLFQRQQQSQNNDFPTKDRSYRPF